MIARIAICTYHRPHLLRAALDAVVTQRLPSDWQLHVLIVDNDAQRSAEPVAAEFAGASCIGIEYIVAKERGVGNARNTALEHGGEFDVLIFFDDDQIPDDDWLVALLSRHSSDPGSLWCGPVVPNLPRELPDWARGGWPWSRPALRDGALLQVCGDGNLLIPRTYVQSGCFRYSQAFSSGMGQDAELTYRLSDAGTEIRYAAPALAREEIPADRITPDWVLDRAFHSSDAWARILLLRNTRGRIRLVLSAIRRTLSCLTLSFLGFAQRRPDLALRGRRDWAIVRAYAGKFFAPTNSRPSASP